MATSYTGVWFNWTAANAAYRLKELVVYLLRVHASYCASRQRVIH